MEFAAEPRQVKVQLAAAQMPIAAVMRLWPKFAARDVREYLAERLRAAALVKGEMMLDFDAAALATFGTPAPLPEESMRIDFAVTNAAFVWLNGAPPLVGLDATGRVTGRAANVTATRGGIDLGGGKRLALADGVFAMPDFHRKPAPASLTARVTGSLESVGDLLDREALKAFGGAHIDTASMKGQLDGKLSVDMRIQKGSRTNDAVVRVAGAVNAFSIDKLVGKERECTADPHVRPSPLDALAKIRPAFGGVQTGGNSSGIVDGAVESVVQFLEQDTALRVQNVGAVGGDLSNRAGLFGNQRCIGHSVRPLPMRSTKLSQ